MDYKGGHECKEFHEGGRDSDIKGSSKCRHTSPLHNQQQAPSSLRSGFPILLPELMMAHLAKFKKKLAAMFIIFALK